MGPLWYQNFLGVFTNKLVIVIVLVNFREYISLLKIAFSRSIYQPKINETAFGGRAPPKPAGGVYSAPQTPS